MVSSLHAARSVHILQHGRLNIFVVIFYGHSPVLNIYVANGILVIELVGFNTFQCCLTLIRGDL